MGLLPYLAAHGLVDQLITPPADITLAFDTLIQPDLAVAETEAFIRSGVWADVTRLFLVIEVSSASSSRTDRMLKRPAYQTFGVPNYWIVDGEEQAVEVWTPQSRTPMVARELLRWRHPALTEECEIELARLFDFSGGARTGGG